MIHHFAELNPRKIAVLLILALVAFRMGMSVVDDVLHVPESLSESCQSQEDVIKQLLDTGNYCTTNNDCVAIPFNCPFGCNTYLNLSIETLRFRKKLPPILNNAAIA